MIKLLLIILLLPVHVLPDNYNPWLIERETIKCAIEIAKQYFDNSPVGIHFTSLSQENDTGIQINTQNRHKMHSFISAVIEELFNGLNWPIFTFYFSIINFVTDNKIYNIPSDQHISILTPEFNEDIAILGIHVSAMLAHQDTQMNLSYKTKIIVILIRNHELDELEKEMFFNVIEESFNSTKLHKVLIILTQISSDPTDLQPGTQYPVWQSENCGHFKEFVLLDRWSNNEHKSFQYLTNHFTSRIPKSLEGCTVFYHNVAGEKKICHIVWKFQ